MKFLSSVKAVFLDADDTLFFVSPGVAEIYARICADHGLHVPVEKLRSSLPITWSGFRAEYENVANNYETFPGREREMWRKFSILAIEKFHPTPPTSLLDEIYDEFAKERSRRLFPGVVEFLQHLKTTGYKIGLLSNNDERMMPLLDELGLSHYFDEILPTALIGFKKPASLAYERAALRIGSAPEEILYIGDSLEHDYHGARNANWNAIWFNSKKKPIPEPKPHMVSSFDELLRLFKPLRSPSEQNTKR